MTYRSVVVAMLLLARNIATAQVASPAPPVNNVVPPAVLQRVDAQYPAAALAARTQADVVLTVTIDITGRVTDVGIAQSGGAQFDQAAISAVQQWRFSPAMKNGTAIASRIRVPFSFVLPSAHPAARTSAAGNSAARTGAELTHKTQSSEIAGPQVPTQPPGLGPAAAAAIEVEVRGQRRVAARGSSDFVLQREVLTAAPHRSAASLLSSAPGVYVAQAEGDAIAHHVYLRGFDAEHGQDIEFRIGPMPINQPAHIHGQGYADLNFILPEVVQSVRVTEGIYDPRQGDFAVAGSIDYELGVPQRGYLFKSSYGPASIGSNSFRQLMLWAPKNASQQSFVAAAISRTEGFGQNRGALSGTAMGQYELSGIKDWRMIIQAAAHAARANVAGVLRLDDVDAGRVDYYGSYPDPSANAQSAYAARTHSAVQLVHGSSQTGESEISLWFMLAAFRARENFTGYTQRSQLNPDWIGRGDLIEQENQDVGLGALLRHKTAAWTPKSWLSNRFELGVSLNTHWIGQAANLLQAPQNATWDNRVDADIRTMNLGLYADLQTQITRYVQLRGGVRADVLHFDIDDRLGNFIPNYQRQTHLVGYRRTALGVAFGPRIAIEVNPKPWLQVIGAYGEGYRSPQARQLEEGENAPFAKVRGFEAGVRVRLFKNRAGADLLSATAAGYATFLSNDLAFDPVQGALEKIGPTRRLGAAGHIILAPWQWLFASLSLTYVKATLTQPPPATAENPAPPYTPGQGLPYVPPIVFRADIALRRDFFRQRLKHNYIEGRLGTGVTALSSRPLPFGMSSDAVGLWDLSGSLRWRWVELGVEVFNVLNTRYAANEYSFVSNWQTRAVPSLLPARHIAAGAPRQLNLNLSLYF